MSDLLRLVGKWRRLDGCLHSLQQPTLAGFVAVGTAVPGGGQRAEAVLTELAGGQLGQGADALRADERLVQLLCRAAGALQRANGIAVSERFHVRREAARQAAGESWFAAALPAPSLPACERTLRWLLALVNRLSGDDLAESPRSAAQHELAPTLRPYALPGVNSLPLVQTALRLDIPVQPMGRGIFLLGTGARARWLASTITDRTPWLGVVLAKMKHETAQLLRTAGLPGAVNRLVNSRESALRAAHDFGFPVVVKPADRDQGVGVAADLREDAQVERAYDAARSASELVLVEKWAAGSTHRLTVLNDRVIRVTRRVAGGVVGDGHSDIAALVRLKQREDFHQAIAQAHGGQPRLELDDEALDLLMREGLDAQHVPALGRYVRLRRRDNVSAGGWNEDLDLADPAAVHPDNLWLARDAARLLHLDMAGVDLITTDIGRSWLESGALICEVNAQPQLGAERFYEGVLRELLGHEPCVPAELHVVPADAGVRSAALQRLLQPGQPQGVSDMSGIFISGERRSAVFQNGYLAARAILRRPDVTAVASLLSPEEILQHGLPAGNWRLRMAAEAGQFTPQERARLQVLPRLLQTELTVSGG